MSNPTSNFNWQMPTASDLVTDLPADFEVFGQAVDTSLADLKGGTTGQILSKTSNTDMDFTWTSPNPGDITGVTAGTGISGGGTSGDVTITNSMATAIDAKGDLIAGTGADAFSRLGVGSNGQVLTADSTAGTGLAWGSVSGTDFVRINTQTFTSQTAVNCTSVFSSTYKNYVIKLNITSSAAGQIRARMRSGTTDNTNSNYYSTLRYSRIDGSNDGLNKQSAVSSFLITDINGGWGSQTINVYLPFESNQTVIGMDNFFYAYASGDNYYLGDVAGSFNQTTSFDGITIYGGAAFSGEISIYGVKRS